MVKIVKMKVKDKIIYFQELLQPKLMIDRLIQLPRIFVLKEALLSKLSP